jgi:Ca-activated chloride channel family protein
MKRAVYTIVVAGLAGLLSSCQPQSQFSIVSGSENTAIEPIVQEFCKEQNTICKVTYSGTLDIGLALQSADGVAEDAVWPASGVWVDMFDEKRRVKNLKSIAQMPVILGVRKAKAEELGWVGRPVYMKDILAAVNGGALKFLMTSATQSNSGASAYLSMLSSALGGKQVIEPGDLDKPDVQNEVRQLLGGVERSSGSSQWLADLYVDSSQRGKTYDAMWNYEAVLKETNEKLVANGKEPFYFVYPTDGVAVADSPLGFVDHGRGADVQAFFDKLQVYLQSPAVQKRIVDTGRRIPFGSAAAAPVADWNFDPAKIVTAIRLPEPDVIRQALTLYQVALRKPSLLVACLDFSGSMNGKGEEQLQDAMNFLLTPSEAEKVLSQWTPQDRIVLIPFDSSPRGVYSDKGTADGQATLLSSVTTERAGGGTDMYACGRAAMAEIAKTPALSSYLTAVVIMTDGRSDGDREAFMRSWRAEKPGVPVFGITFGDADVSQLDVLARETSARVFDGRSDLAGAFRAVRGYN